MPKSQSTNILIVGSGVAGGLIAEELLKNGVADITMLEAGPNVVMRDRRIWLDTIMAKQAKLPYENLTDTPKDYEANGVWPWIMEGGRLFARGGTTLHWDGWCPRYKPEDFQLRSRTGKGMDWPFTYEELAPYYEKAEWFLQVAGDSHYPEPPRKKPYPFEAAPYTRTDGVVIKALEKMDISYMHMPLARNAKPINGRPACMTTGTCQYCPLGARFTGDQPLDRLAENQKFRLYLNSPVRRILTSGKTRVIGVEYLDMTTGETQTIEAQTVILCNGAIEIPKLLLASTNHEWPNGIGNETDQVGRYPVTTPYLYSIAKTTSNPKAYQEELHFITLGSRHWDTPKEQQTGENFFWGTRGKPNVKLGELMSAGKSVDEIETATRRGEQIFELHGIMSALSHFDNQVTLARGTTRFGLPRTALNIPKPTYSQKQANTNLNRLRKILLTMGYTPITEGVVSRIDHTLSTCRMSQSPKEGVVGANFRVHEMDNLYVVSNAVFPSKAAANPTLTLAALGFKFVEGLLKEITH